MHACMGNYHWHGSPDVVTVHGTKSKGTTGNDTVFVTSVSIHQIALSIAARIQLQYGI